MHLTGMEIRETPPFTEWVDLEFDRQVNLFIGPNASGKSTILNEIDAAFNGDEDRDAELDFLENGEERRRTHAFTGASRRLSEREGDGSKWNWISKSEDWQPPPITFAQQTDNTWKEPPVVYIGHVRTGLPELSSVESAAEDSATVDEVLSRPFSGENLYIANEKMIREANAMSQEEKEEDAPSEERRAYRIFDIAYPCVGAICSEVVVGTQPRNYVTGSVDDLDFQPFAGLPNFDVTTIHRSMGVTTTDQPNFSNVRPRHRPTYSERMGPAPLYAGFLSSGTQTTFLWIHWLAYKMLHHYEFADGWKDKPAILLIDEIENHLHPTWQRRVIPALLENFKGLQIFATTHSPFVVAGLRSGQVHLLDRDENGVITASTNERDIIGWTTDEILRTFMGVDEPTDELTIRRAKRLRELRGKESLSDDERGELEDLRQQVNEDLLSSSSPLELQRERYADMMLRFIQSRESELSQDGG